jgi:hypothetical protein
MKVVEVQVFTFEELSEGAKEKARQWWREGGLDYKWWEFVYEGFKEKATGMGFDVTNIYFSGFWSQGDGAMFEYHRLDNKLLLQFVEGLKLSPMRKQWLVNNAYVSGSGRHSGHYYHSGCCTHSIYWQVDNGQLHWSTNFYRWIESFVEDFEYFIKGLYEELCSELYKSLEKEYEHLMSDEYVDECIIINEYEFLENGSRY